MQMDSKDTLGGFPGVLHALTGDLEQHVLSGVRFRCLCRMFPCLRRETDIVDVRIGGKSRSSVYYRRTA